MDTIEEPQLFGAPADWVNRITLTITLTKNGLRSVTLYGHVNNKKATMSLIVLIPEGVALSPVTGRMMTLIQRAEHTSPSLMRRTFWAMYGGLGNEGYEVSLDGCGKEPH